MTSISLYGIGGHCCFDIDSLGGLFVAKFFDADGNAVAVAAPLGDRRAAL